MIVPNSPIFLFMVEDGRKKMIGIYCIRNAVNGKRYIGQSVGIENRRRSHFSSLRNGSHYSKHLQRAFVKYGVEVFEFVVLEECDENMLDVRERVWIGYYQTTDLRYGYNNDSGGNLNKHHSDETRRKISESNSGQTRSVMTRLKISEANKHKTEESRRKQGDSLRGHIPSVETLRKRSESMMGHLVSKETRRKISESKKHLSEESHRRLSEAKMGHFVSDESRRKMSESHKNPSVEIRLKMSEAGKNRPPISEETRRKLSDAGKGRHHTEESIRKMSEVKKLRNQERKAMVEKSELVSN